tara:strand:+ start:889 stop:1839 length:951 start_codon:yes stop_codon:yes gene_type:complete
MNFEINEKTIFEIDSLLAGQDLKQYDYEIEKIVNNLWKDIGEFEEILSPFFTIYLNNHLLPSLYINYLSLVTLKEKHTNINVKASTTIIDHIGKKLNLNLDAKRRNYDAEFHLNNSYFLFLNHKASGQLLQRFLRKVFYKFLFYWGIFKGVDVIYMDAGKLEHDFSIIPNSLNANYIPFTQSIKEAPDIEKIKDTVRKNVNKMDLSIPSDLIIEVLEDCIFKYLSLTLNRIFVLYEFIETHKVKLVISSAVTNDLCLCLLAASKLSKIDSLIIPHGLVTTVNPWLDGYFTYQGTLNDFEKKYDDSIQIHFKASWFA